MNSENSEREIKSWLECVLIKEKLKNLSVDYWEKMGKGGGFVGDVLFVNVKGTTENGSEKEIHLVLKCSKQSQALRESNTMKYIFSHEIYVYSEILPFFLDFQLERSVRQVFNSIPKYYGSFSNENTDVIVLENLKKTGYDLWNKKTPMTRNHIDLVMTEYGKFHAISAALKHQDPKKFDDLAKRLPEMFAKSVSKESGLVTTLEKLMHEVYDLFKNDLEESVISKWKSLESKVKFIFSNLLSENCFKVIIHGDCWNNNFMFQCDTGDKEIPSKVAILDWQISQLLTPIVDLSYFIFSCISQDDIEDLDAILRTYHQSFANHLKELGVNPDETYPLTQLLEDWQNYSKFGIVMACLPIKISMADDEDLPDIGETAETGKPIAENFEIEIKDKNVFKDRIVHVVNYVAKQDLI